MGEFGAERAERRLNLFAFGLEVGGPDGMCCCCPCDVGVYRLLLGDIIDDGGSGSNAWLGLGVSTE